MTFSVGDKVLLNRLEDWFYNGMEANEASGLKALVGQTWTVEGFDDSSGTYELVYEHLSRSISPLEWVSVSPDWISRID